MITSHDKYDVIENFIYNEGLKIKSLEFNTTHKKMVVHLTNDATFIVPTNHYQRLRKASAKQLKNFELIGGGVGIHWPELDEDLSLKGFLKNYYTDWLHKKMN